jgi:membrane fusion protein, multidrug efflux system
MPRPAHVALLAVAVVIGATALLGSCLRRAPAPESASSARPSGSAPPAPVIPVDVYVVKARPFDTKVMATGTLVAAESVELVSEVSRRLVRIRANEGTPVKKGQVLFELDKKDLAADLRLLAVQHKLAQTNFERQKKLLAEGVTSRQEWETAQNKVDELSAQRSSLGVTLAKTTIRAPFAGTLGLRRVSEGAWVTPSTVLATLQDTSKLKLDFTLPERYAPLLAVDMPFRFSVAAHGAEHFEARVTAIEPVVSQASRSIQVRGIVERAGKLSPGSFATVELPLSTGQALLVPNLSVVPSVDGRRVFVVKDGVVRSVKVELGERSAELVQVLSGIAPGDQVVTTNLLRMRDGARVRTPGSGPSKGPS